jgi:D-glycero-D-manno-heptose 1,7-bisphosphate phosphatase
MGKREEAGIAAERCVWLRDPRGGGGTCDEWVGRRREAAIFLDRDGVVIEPLRRGMVPGAARHVREMALRPGVEEACAKLHLAGFWLIIVTNQPDVARGFLAARELRAMHEALAEALPVDDIVVCTHDDRDRCVCRKPAPGMLIAAAERYGLRLGASFMVGDRWRDIEAGRRAGCRTILVDCGWDEPQRMVPDYVTDGLEGAAVWILQGGGVRTTEVGGRQGNVGNGPVGEIVPPFVELRRWPQLVQAAW